MPRVVRQMRLARARQFEVEEFQIELGIVDDKRRIGDEGKKIVGDRREDRRVGKLVRRQAVDPNRVFRDVAFGLHQRVEHPARRQMPDKLKAADLDDPVTIGRIETGGFGVEHNFAHGHWRRFSAARRRNSAATRFT